MQTVHLFLALDAIDSPGNGLESLLGNFPLAFETRTVLPGLEPRQRDFDLAEEAVCPLQVVRLRFPLGRETRFLQVLRGSFGGNLAAAAKALP
jgi:hypothetical protein